LPLNCPNPGTTNRLQRSHINTGNDRCHETGDGVLYPTLVGDEPRYRYRPILENFFAHGFADLCVLCGTKPLKNINRKEREERKDHAKSRLMTPIIMQIARR